MLNDLRTLKFDLKSSPKKYLIFLSSGGNIKIYFNIVLLERIQTQVEIQRRSGNTNPVATVIWLQAAEPGPGLPELDFTVLGGKCIGFVVHLSG